MKRAKIIGITLIGAVLLGFTLMKPSVDTSARFADSAAFSGGSFATDSFFLEHSELTLHPKVSDFRKVWSIPGELITNKAETGDMLVRLNSFTVNPADPSLKSSELVESLTVAYAIARGNDLRNCASVDPEQVSERIENISTGSNNLITQTQEIVLSPGESVLLCPQIALKDASSNDNEIAQIYREKAGQAITVTTSYENVFPSASGESPKGANWGQQIEATHTYLINAPNIRITDREIQNCGGNPVLSPRYIEIPFAWPTEDSKVSGEPAIHHWEVYYRQAGSNDPWELVGSQKVSALRYPRGILLDRLDNKTEIQPDEDSVKIRVTFFEDFGVPDGDGFNAIEVRFRGYLNLSNSPQYYVGSDRAIRVRAKYRHGVFDGRAIGECALLDLESTESHLPVYFTDGPS